MCSFLLKFNIYIINLFLKKTKNKQQTKTYISKSLSRVPNLKKNIFCISYNVCGICDVCCCYNMPKAQQ